MSIAKNIVKEFGDNNVRMFHECGSYPGVDMRELKKFHWGGNGIMWTFPDDSSIYTLSVYNETFNTTTIKIVYCNKTKTAKRYIEHTISVKTIQH